jgi:hypothetical protein
VRALTMHHKLGQSIPVNSPWDSPPLPPSPPIQERYEKALPAVNRYAVIQLGICAFTRDLSGEGYAKPPLVARPYNIYVFPSQGDDMTLNLSSISFLRDQVRGGGGR